MIPMILNILVLVANEIFRFIFSQHYTIRIYN